ncbi:hypothetical protein LSCM1_05391 [Leishmania martiniquensis]|uniref:Mitochondrial RNA binding complex 1 subunit n=1 Tax=Leishmania martiniquensis TaxID=1580590 RepID=A0A836KJZ3_9TRYP|nr:hypothetical protein LSCM1_05391 [Leishmania martiniquensis]
MRPFSLVSRSRLCSGRPAAPLVAVAAVASASRAVGYSVSAVRWQSSRPYSRTFGGSRGSGSPRPPNGPPPPSSVMNSTGDGELSAETRAALRDDSIVMTEVVRHIPPKGAISIKSLSSAIDENIQEALSERHGGLRRFLEQRKQFFMLHTNPEDGVLYVLCNPIIIQQYATRDAQRKTMRRMMGLDDGGHRQQQQLRRSGGGNRGRGGRGGRGGSGDRRYQGSPSSSGPARPPPPPQQQQRGEGGSSSYGGRGGRRGRGGSNGGRGGDGAFRRGGPMGSQSQSFGNR